MRRRFRRYFGTCTIHSETCARYGGTCTTYTGTCTTYGETCAIHDGTCAKKKEPALPYCSTGTTIMPSMSSTH